MKPKRIIYLCLIVSASLIAFINFFCNKASTATNTSPYLNHQDSVKYVGIETCRSCHGDIYDTYIRTGMGKSFGHATKQRSSAAFGDKHIVYDAKLNFYYKPFNKGDSIFIMEFRLDGKDTIYKRIERIDFIVGSGQHTNSHLQFNNGYISQLPITWYAQEKKWELPPGFEDGRNKRFSRVINVECMSCHNAMPVVDAANDQKFVSVPNGIDCERCHGPGEIHVKEKLAGRLVDTATQIDYTIVNPAKLSWERQIDLCQRCHLQGNAVLKQGKLFTQFRPGQTLSDYVDVFMPRYTGAEDEFIMASHAQRLQMSDCFVKSAKEQATSKLTCITCHNPHVSVKETGTQIFNTACGNCHNMQTGCKEEKQIRVKSEDNCVGCHMPQSGTIDIPHVTVHDHKIKVPTKATDESKLKQFAGLYCINNIHPDDISRAQAFINYYEKFEGEPVSLDSALLILRGIKNDKRSQAMMIHVYYLKDDFRSVTAIANDLQAVKCNDPWLAYRIGASYQQLNLISPAEIWLQRCTMLSPDQYEFINKLAVNYYLQNKLDAALRMFNISLEKYSNQPETWSNVGYIYIKRNDLKTAYQYLNKALMLDPDSKTALANMASYYTTTGNRTELSKISKRIQALNTKS